METNIIGVCKSDYNTVDQDFILKRQKKIYISISETEKLKLKSLFKDLPIKNNLLTVGMYGCKDISCILNKVYTYHVTVHKMKHDDLGGNKLILKGFKPYFS